jgi:hypothetical protein
VLIDGGALATAVPATNAQDLRFVTRYRLTWPDALKSLGEMLWYEGGLLLMALLFLPLPGALLLLDKEINRRGREERQDFFMTLVFAYVAVQKSPCLVGLGAGVGNGRVAFALVWADIGRRALARLVFVAGVCGWLAGGLDPLAEEQRSRGAEEPR